MAYTPPMTQVFLTAATAPTVLRNPRRACIVGGSAWRARYSDPTTQSRGLIGSVPGVTTNYAWPNLPLGLTPDMSTASVIVQNALQRYATINPGANTFSGNTLNFTGTTTYLKTASGFTRNALFNDRDVAAGDIVTLRNTAAPGTPAFTAKILRVYAQTPSVPNVYGTFTNSVANPATQSASQTVTFVASSGPTPTNFTVTASATAYNGHASGKISETYTLTCLTASTGGDPTTALFSVTSASGTDNQASVTPAASGAPFAIGTRGATATITVTSGANCVVGQKWTVVINGAYAQAGGTVTVASPDNAPVRTTTAIVTVIRGGKYTDSILPMVSVSYSDGTDAVPATVVTTAGTVVPLNSYGTTFVFTGTALRLGDQFTVAITPTAALGVTTVDLDRAIPSAYLVASTTTTEFHILTPSLTVPAVPTIGVTNWTLSSSQVSITGPMQVYNASWTASGIPQLLNVVPDRGGGNYSKLYVDYRAWYPPTNKVQVVVTPADLDAVYPEATVFDNPLKYNIAQAIANANGTPICFVPVSDPSNVSAWAASLSVLTNDNTTGVTVAELVPLTSNPQVLSLFTAHITAMSSPAVRMWRRAWYHLADVSQIPLVHNGTTVPRHTTATTTDGNICQASIGGTGNTVVTSTTLNGNFITNGAQAGDILRCNFQPDGTYTSFTIATVPSNDVVTLVTGPSAPLVSAKIEIWHPATATEQANELALQSGSYGSALVRTVLPQQVEVGGVLVSGHVRASIFAGLASGVLQHQPLIRLTVAGVTNEPAVLLFGFNGMNILAGGGVTMFDVNPVDGSIFVRDALTTAGSGTDFYYEDVVRNFHAIAAYFADILDVYIGKTNAVDPTLTQLKLDVNDGIRNLKQTAVLLLGSPLLEGTQITNAFIDPVLRDSVEIDVDCVLPRALRHITLRLNSI